MNHFTIFNALSNSPHLVVVCKGDILKVPHAVVLYPQSNTIIDFDGLDDVECWDFINDHKEITNRFEQRQDTEDRYEVFYTEGGAWISTKRHFSSMSEAEEFGTKFDAIGVLDHNTNDFKSKWADNLNGDIDF